MTDQSDNDVRNDMYIFETTQLIGQLEKIILNCELTCFYGEEDMNEIFRIIHTIKGSSALMKYNNITNLAHNMEDLFYFLREERPKEINYKLLTDLLLSGLDFIKIEIEKIKRNMLSDGDPSDLIRSLQKYLMDLRKDAQDLPVYTEDGYSEQTPGYFVKSGQEITCLSNQCYKVVIYFSEGSEMENIRAYSVIHKLKSFTQEITHFPEELIHDVDSLINIRENGFYIYFKSDHTYEYLFEFFCQTIFLKDLELFQFPGEEEFEKEILDMGFSAHGENTVHADLKEMIKQEDRKEPLTPISIQNIISVNVNKIDKLIDLVGEMVMTEAMVIQNPDLQGLELNSFHKAARQLNKITLELQDIVMSIRMIPLTTTFQKMHRIVRDMSKKQNKEIKLAIIGEETEVDKNIMEHISDPLMHLVRNAIDHGIEAPAERERSGKAQAGTITLEAKNIGSDVVIRVNDDGRGLDKEKILKRAEENRLLKQVPENMTEKEIYHMILLPGLSTKDNVTEYSGRGVGMDVVSKNIESIGGLLSVDSNPGKGTTITMKIPLTMAVVDGMNIRVGQSYFTIPVATVVKSFRLDDSDQMIYISGEEMVMVRGNCYRLIRLWKEFNLKSDYSNSREGIIIMVEIDTRIFCLLADELLGKQQVVVKTLPKYIQNFDQTKKLSGCTLLGNGSLSLILDVSNLL